MRIAIGLVFAGGFPIPASFVMSWTRMLQAIGAGCGNELLPAERPIDEYNIIYSDRFPIDCARNEVCREFLDKDPRSEYLAFLDADMVHPPDAIHRLVKHGVDVVSGRYTMRHPPYFSVAMRKTGIGPLDYDAIEKVLPLESIRGLLPIDGGGAGALLISRRCLTLIRARVGDDWFRYQDGPAGLRSRSEDMWFYEQAIAAGCQPLLDADLWCGHERREIVMPSAHVEFSKRYADVMASMGKREEAQPA